MIAAWHTALAWLGAVPGFWFILGAAALYAACTTKRRDVRR